MEITVTLETGQIDAEFAGEDREEIEGELLDFIEFIEENEEEINGVPQPSRGSQPVEIASPSDGSDAMENTSMAADIEFGVQPIAAQTQADASDIAQIIEIPDDTEEPPFLTLDIFEEGNDVLGPHRNQKQAQASVLILFAYQECRNQEGVEYDILDTALSYSGIDIERRDAMGSAFGDDARNWFDSDGNMINLTSRGEHQARELIRELIEEL